MSDQISVYLLGAGVPSEGTFLRGDGRWESPPASGGPPTQLLESGGATLAIGSIPDGYLGQRVGLTFVGVDPATLGGGGGAPVGAPYLVLSLDPTLTSERKLVAATGLLLTDGGANGDATLAPDFGSAAGKIAQGNDARFTDDRVASALRNATGIVDGTAAAAPTAGQVYTATSPTTAAWQTPAAGGGGGEYGVGGHKGGAGPTGRLYLAGQVVGTALTTVALAANALRAIPIRCPQRSGTIDLLAAYCSTAVASTNIRLGIYRDTGGGVLYPGALVFDSGLLSTGAIGLKSAACSVPFSPGEILWLVVASSGAPTLRAVPTAAAEPCYGTDAAFGTAIGLGLNGTVAFAALADPFPAVTTALTANPPAIGVRFNT